MAGRDAGLFAPPDIFQERKRITNLILEFGNKILENLFVGFEKDSEQ
jgi:hypothetical protein